MDKVLKRKKDDSMYDSRYIELEKLMNIINKLNKELQLVKKDINNKESKSKEVVSYIEQKIKEKKRAAAHCGSSPLWKYAVTWR